MNSVFIGILITILAFIAMSLAASATFYELNLDPVSVFSVEYTEKSVGKLFICILLTTSGSFAAFCFKDKRCVMLNALVNTTQDQDGWACAGVSKLLFVIHIKAKVYNVHYISAKSKHILPYVFLYVFSF